MMSITNIAMKGLSASHIQIGIAISQCGTSTLIIPTCTTDTGTVKRGALPRAI
jgi:hypothetical protein